LSTTCSVADNHTDEDSIERPLHRLNGCLLCGGEKVDAETFFTSQLERLNNRVSKDANCI
jgi:hypothetical protein